MAETIYNSKLVGSNGEVFMDLTADTVAANKLLAGFTAHDASGAPVTGTCAFDVDSSDATATPDEVLSGETFAANGELKTGTMPNRGAVTGTIAAKDAVYTVPMGFHDGSGTVGIDATEKAKIIAENIKQGIELLGVTGSYGGGEVTAQSKSAVPTFTAQTITPDEGYDYLSQVTVAAIPVTKVLNAQGGYTVTIGG